MSLSRALSSWLWEVQGNPQFPVSLQDCLRDKVLPKMQITISTDIFAAASVFRGIDDIRYYLNGLYLETGENGARLVGCDGIQLAVAKLEGRTWSEVGGSNAFFANHPINIVISDLAGNIYAAGDFTNASGNYYVAKYSATTGIPTLTTNQSPLSIHTRASF